MVAPMPGRKTHELKCEKCGWNKLVISNGFDLPWPFGKKDKKICPKCGGKLSRNDDVLVAF